MDTANIHAQRPTSSIISNTTTRTANNINNLNNLNNINNLNNNNNKLINQSIDINSPKSAEFKNMAGSIGIGSPSAVYGM